MVWETSNISWLLLAQYKHWHYSIIFPLLIFFITCDGLLGAQRWWCEWEREIQGFLRRAIPGLIKEKFLNIVWSTLLMRVRSAQDSRGFSLMNSLSKLLQSLGDFYKQRADLMRIILMETHNKYIKNCYPLLFMFYSGQNTGQSKQFRLECFISFTEWQCGCTFQKI